MYPFTLMMMILTGSAAYYFNNVACLIWACVFGGLTIISICIEHFKLPEPSEEDKLESYLKLLK